MLKKNSVDSIMKQFNTAILKLSDLADIKDREAVLITQKISDLEIGRDEAFKEQTRARKVIKKLEDLLDLD